MTGSAWAQSVVRARAPSGAGAAFVAPAAPSAPAARRSFPVLSAPSLAPAPLPAPTPVGAEASAFMETIARGERPFYQPGVAFDAATGMTFDSHPTDFRTGELRGEPRELSAASKESLHIILLIKALKGEREARLALSPDPNDPSKAVAAALETLEKKITSYEAFHRDHPGYGGFLPWFQTKEGRVVPDGHWERRVPALDNGQLAWSLYAAANALKELGHEDLARRYQARLDLMARSVVPVFFDPAAKKIRGVAVLKEGNRIAPEANAYATEGYLIDDAHEGLLMVHFADLFGNWEGREKDREALWSRPLRHLTTYERKGRRFTVEEAWVGSSHEQWGSLILPFQDEPLAEKLFANAQRVRTFDAASRRWPGLRASTHRPVHGDAAPEYVTHLGIEGIGTDKSSRARIFAPYAAFPLAIVDKDLFAAWLKRMVSVPGMRGPYGIGESFDFAGTKRAPILTWDGKALPLIAWLGGITADIRRLLIRDGLYDGFRARVAADYARFHGRTIEGADTPLTPPPARRSVGRKVSFTGVKGRDVYNPTAPFTVKFRGRVIELLAARVEARSSESSEVMFFEKSGRRWRPLAGAPVLKLQDPFFSKMGDEFILGGVQTSPRADGGIGYRTVFYRGKDLAGMTLFAHGPDDMKDIRLIAIPGGKILVLTRPQGKIGGRGKIAVTTIDGLKSLGPEAVNRAAVYEDLFSPEEWGGANELHLLKNGLIGVLGHIARFDAEGNRHYQPMAFAIDPETGRRWPMKILLERSQLPPGASKRPDLADVLFSGGLIRRGDGTAELYVGAGDAEVYRADIPDPFADFENFPR